MNKNIELIKDTGLLSSNEIKDLGDLRFELEETMDTVQIFRTETEMEISVLSDLKHPTPDSKYWQIQREQNVMWEQLVQLSFEYKTSEQEIIILESEVEELDNKIYDTETYMKKRYEAEKQIKILEIGQKRFMMLSQKRVAQDRLREIKSWHNIKATLKPLMEFGTENVNDHQLGSYLHRFINQYASVANTGFEGMGIAEINNLKGQLITSIRVAKEKNVYDNVMLKLPVETVMLIEGGSA